MMMRMVIALTAVLVALCGGGAHGQQFASKLVYGELYDMWCGLSATDFRRVTRSHDNDPARILRIDGHGEGVRFQVLGGSGAVSNNAIIALRVEHPNGAGVQCLCDRVDTTGSSGQYVNLCYHHCSMGRSIDLVRYDGVDGALRTSSYSKRMDINYRFWFWDNQDNNKQLLEFGGGSREIRFVEVYPCAQNRFGTSCQGLVTCSAVGGVCDYETCFGRVGNGLCTACKPHFVGPNCDTCAPNYFLSNGACVTASPTQTPTHSPTFDCGLSVCGPGAATDQASCLYTGECLCVDPDPNDGMDWKPQDELGIGEAQCCSYGTGSVYSNCLLVDDDCGCHGPGTVPGSCETHGRCICYTAFSGPLCDECADTPCSRYALDYDCDVGAACPCLDGVIGDTCDDFDFLGTGVGLDESELDDFCEPLLDLDESERCACGFEYNTVTLTCDVPSGAVEASFVCADGLTPLGDVCVVTTNLTSEFLSAAYVCESVGMEMLGGVQLENATAVAAWRAGDDVDGDFWLYFDWATVDRTDTPTWPRGTSFFNNNVSAAPFEPNIVKLGDARYNCLVLSSADGIWRSEPCSGNGTIACQEPRRRPVCPDGYGFDYETQWCAPLAEARPTCDTAGGWAPVTGSGDFRCALFPSVRTDFDNARAFCRGVGGHLASIYDNNETAELLSAAGSSNWPRWIGLANTSAEMQFWTDGYDVTAGAAVCYDAGGCSGAGWHCGALDAAGLWVVRDCMQNNRFVCTGRPTSCPGTMRLSGDRCVLPGGSLLRSYTQEVFCGERAVRSGDPVLMEKGAALLEASGQCLQAHSGVDGAGTPAQVMALAGIGASALRDFYFTGDNLDVFDPAAPLAVLYNSSGPFFYTSTLSVLSGVEQFGAGLLDYRMVPLTSNIRAFLTINSVAFKSCERVPCPCGQRRGAGGVCVAEADNDVLLELYTSYGRCALVPVSVLREKLTLVPPEDFISASLFCLRGSASAADAVARAVAEVVESVNLLEVVYGVTARTQRLRSLANKCLQNLALPPLAANAVPSFSMDIQRSALVDFSDRLLSRARFTLQQEIAKDLRNELRQLGAALETRLVAIQVQGDDVREALADLGLFTAGGFAGVHGGFAADAAATVLQQELELDAVADKKAALIVRADGALEEMQVWSDRLNASLEEGISPTLEKLIDLKRQYDEQAAIYNDAKAELDKKEAIVNQITQTVGMGLMMTGVGGMVAGSLLSAAGPAAFRRELATGLAFEFEWGGARRVLPESCEDGEDSEGSESTPFFQLQRERRPFFSSQQLPRVPIVTPSQMRAMGMAAVRRAADSSRGYVRRAVAGAQAYSGRLGTAGVAVGSAAGGSLLTYVAVAALGGEVFFGGIGSYFSSAGLDAALAGNVLQGQVGATLSVGTAQDFCRAQLSLSLCADPNSEYEEVLVSCCKYRVTRNENGVDQTDRNECQAFDATSVQCSVVRDEAEKVDVTADYAPFQTGVGQAQQVKRCEAGTLQTWDTLKGMVRFSCCGSDCNSAAARDFWENSLKNQLEVLPARRLGEESDVLQVDSPRKLRCCKCGKKKGLSTGTKMAIGGGLGLATLAGGAMAAFGSSMFGERETFATLTPLPDVITNEQLDNSMLLMRAALDKVWEATTELVVMFIELTQDFGYDLQQTRTDGAASSHPALWDSLYHEVMDLLEYDLELCPSLVPDGGQGSVTRRALLARQLGVTVPTTDMRRALRSKSELRDDLKAAEKELERITTNFTQQEAILEQQCGHFRGALRQVTTWAKASHETMLEAVDNVRAQRTLEGQIAVVEAREEQAQVAIADALLDGDKLAVQLRRKIPIVDKAYTRSDLLEDLAEAVHASAFQEDQLEMSFVAESVLASFCSSVRYVGPGLDNGGVLSRACALRQDTSGALLGVSLQRLGEQLQDAAGAIQTSVYSHYVDFGREMARGVELDVSELIDFDLLRDTGVASFSLAGPGGGRSGRPGGAASAAFARGGPWFCSDAVKLDNLELESVGVLFYDVDGDLLGPTAADGGDLRVGIKLKGPFFKSWRGDIHTFEMTAYDNLAFSYHLPSRGACKGSSELLNNVRCTGTVSQQVDITLRPRASPYAHWDISVTAGRSYLRDVYSVKIVADLVGVYNEDLVCRPKTSSYRIGGSVPPGSGDGKGESGGDLGAIVGAVVGVLVLLVVAAAFVVHRRRHSTGQTKGVMGVFDGSVSKPTELSSANPAFRDAA